jgi:glycosyltransferase involved in cell wall biosynthesis
MQTIQLSAHIRSPKVAYIVSRFPALTETFVLYEILAMEKLGVGVELYPLLRTRSKVTHPEAERWVHRAHYLPFLSLAILRAQWYFIRRDLVAYCKVWADVLRGAWGSANYFFGAIAIFPKVVLWAYDMLDQEVVHIHAHFANHPAVAALIIQRLTGIPFSFTARGTDIQVDRHLLKRKVQAAEFAIAVSNYNKTIMIDECGPAVREKIHVVYGGVDVDRLSPPHAKSSVGAFRILCVARFEEVKGHPYLVEACRTLQERGVDFECRLIGDGPLLPSVKKRIEEAGLSKEVRLLGPRVYREVIHELWQSDSLVLPSVPTALGNREGIPNVLKEAMACGLPVVATSIGGIPELVEDGQTGILVPPKSGIALADALQRLYDDPTLRRQLGRAGKERVLRDFSLRTSTTKRASLYLGSSRAGRLFRDFSLNERAERQVPAHHSG